MTTAGEPNPLMRRLDLTLPLVQAPIGGPCSEGLVAASAEAGALGMLPVSWDRPETIAARVAAVRARTAGTFGANLVLEWPQRARLEACLEAGVRVISTFWGDPARLSPAIKDAGAVHLHTVGSVEEARRAADAGVDVVVAQGVEAGGHVRGTIGTLALVPAVVDALGDVPVVAAGGVADGRGLAAVLALGAQAAWVGSALLVAREAGTHPRYRARLLDASTDDTVLGVIFDGGWPDAAHRALSTPTALTRSDRAAIGTRPDGGVVRRYDDFAPTSGTTGDVEAMALYAGQGVGLIREEADAATILRTMAQQASAVLGTLRGPAVIPG